jgi:putative FmdB family regulatory protein
MPLYEYECSACGNRFEQIQKFSDPPVEVCPKCGQREVRKLLSTPAIQFKGTGWYITDYARAGAKESKESADSKEAKESGESKTSLESGKSKESKESKESKKSTESTTSKEAVPSTSSASTSKSND